MSITELEPCPKCGKPVLKGLIHTECVTEPGIYAISQMFDWDSENGDLHITFDVTRILSAIERGDLEFEKVEAPTDVRYITTWLLDVDRAYAHGFSMDKVDEPLLGARMDDDTVLLIDGRHRYYERGRRGFVYTQWHIVPFPLWKPYAVIVTNPMEVDNAK